MRSFLAAALLVCAVGIPGCAMSDMFYALFGGANSNEADLNRANPKNGEFGP